MVLIIIHILSLLVALVSGLACMTFVYFYLSDVEKNKNAQRTDIHHKADEKGAWLVLVGITLLIAAVALATAFFTRE